MQYKFLKKLLVEKIALEQEILKRKKVLRVINKSINEMILKDHFTKKVVK